MEIHMSLNSTPNANRLHIGFFGMRNAGKSSLVNALTGQEISLVSDYAGTTTDPVKKAMELLPLGPVLIIDTPGLDDVGELGEKRVLAAKRVLASCDIGILVVDATRGMQKGDAELLSHMEKRGIPHITVFNKWDLLDSVPESTPNAAFVSAQSGMGIDALKEMIAALAIPEENSRRIVSDLLCHGDHVILVTPIDSAAPKGRLILPQQQTIRDLLDHGCIPIVCRETELEDTMSLLKEPPKMVITDSQAFAKVSPLVPATVPLTSFSILFARYKGNLIPSLKGAAMLSKIKSSDRILISEGCTHHRQCGDIGSVKLPNWIRKHTGENPIFEFTSGNTFPDDLSGISLVIHCGGCMLTEKEMRYRARLSADSGVPITNYGMAIAYMNGILRRSLAPFPEALEILE